MSSPYSAHVPSTAAPLSGPCPATSAFVTKWVKQSAWGSNNFIVPFELIGSNWWVVPYLHNVSASQLGGTFQIFDPNFAWSYPPTFPPAPQWTDSVSQEQRDGWVGIALQVVVGAGSVTLRMWRCYGAGSDVVGPYEQTWSFGTVRAGWTPSPLSSITIGEQSGTTDPFDDVQVRVYDRSTTPTNAEVRDILNNGLADSAAYADWPLTWTAGSVVLQDRSGHGRKLTRSGNITQGSRGPVDPSPGSALVTLVGRSPLAAGTSGSSRTPNGSNIGLQAGDLVVCDVVLRYPGAGSAAISMPAGEGWSLTPDGRQSLSAGAWSMGRYVKVWGKGGGQVDDSTPTITVAGASKWGAILHAYRGVDPNDPFETVAVATGAGATMTAPAATSQGAGRAVLRTFASSDNNNPNYCSEGSPVVSGTTVNVNTGSGYSLGASLLDVVSQGSTGTATMSQSANAPDAYCAWTWVLKPLVSNNVSIISPARGVAADPTVATISVVDDGYTFKIPHVQTSQTFSPVASVPPQILPAGGGVKFVVDLGQPGEVVQYSMGGSGSFGTSFTNLPKAVHTLDVYVVDSGQVVQGGYHDQLQFAIGDVVVAIGDSATGGRENDAGTNGSSTPVHDWTEAAANKLSADRRNFPQQDPADGKTFTGFQVRLNDLLSAAYGYPVFVMNEGVGGYDTAQTIARMAQPSWQSRIAALAPNKWLVHLGGNDTLVPLTKSQYKTNVLAIISTLVNNYGAVATENVWVARPLFLRNFPDNDPYEVQYAAGVDELVAAGACLAGPDFYDWFLNHPEQQDTPGDVHPNAAGYSSTADLWRDVLAP